MSSNSLPYYLGHGLASARSSGSDFGASEIGWYFATDTGQMSFWNGSAWVALNASGATSSAVSANFTTAAGVGHYDVDTTSSAITATLNASPATNDIVEIWDATGHASTHPISLDGNGHNIAGSATLSSFIAVDFGHARLRFNGTQWLTA